MELKPNWFAGVVGGSDLAKAKEQLGEDYLEIVDWAFPENGLNAFKDGKSIAVQSLKTHLGEASLKRFINFVLRYLSEGTFEPIIFVANLKKYFAKPVAEQWTYPSSEERSLSFGME